MTYKEQPHIAQLSNKHKANNAPNKIFSLKIQQINSKFLLLLLLIFVLSLPFVHTIYLNIFCAVNEKEKTDEDGSEKRDNEIYTKRKIKPVSNCALEYI